jgi:hypothetical protein
MPAKEPFDRGDRLGQVMAIMADMRADGDALENDDGPLCGRHVTRIIASGEMVLRDCYYNDHRLFFEHMLMVVAIATAGRKDPIIEIERFLNKKLRLPHVQLLN